MRVVGFKALKKKKKTRNHLFFCVSNVFRNAVLVMGLTTALFVIGLIGGNFSFALKECFENFVSSMSNIKNILTEIFIL